MKTVFDFSRTLKTFLLLSMAFSLTACADDTNDPLPGGDDIDQVNGTGSLGKNEAIFIFIDEDSIDNGNEPNSFSEVEVNDNLAEIGQRRQL